MKTHSKMVDTPEIAAWTAGLIAVILHFAGVTALPAEALGSTLTLIAWPIVMYVIRMANRRGGPGGPPPGPPSDGKGDESATGKKTAVASILLLPAILLCGCVTHVCQDDVVVSIKPSAPSEVAARCSSDAGDKVVLKGVGSATLRVKCPAGKIIGTKAGTDDILGCVEG